jgi:hypothetical protein
VPPGAVALKFVDLALRSSTLCGDHLDLLPVGVGQLERGGCDVGGKMRARGRAYNDRGDAGKIEREPARYARNVAVPPVGDAAERAQKLLK